MQRTRYPIPFLGLFGFFGFLALFTSACQCGVNLISEPAYGTRILKTDLPDNRLDLDKADRLSQTRSFLLYNGGQRSLSVASMDIVDDSEKYYTLQQAPDLPLLLAPGLAKAVALTIQFRAQKPGNYKARLRLFAPEAKNADDKGYFYVDMPAVRGRFGPIFSCAGVLNFGEVERGSKKVMDCELKNAGTLPLEIRSVAYASNVGSPSDFHWLTPTFPLTVAPNEEQAIKIQIAYEPSDYPPAEDEGAFLFETNLPLDRPEDKPQIQVIGKTIVSAVSLFPVYPPCSEDLDCFLIDQRLSCREDAWDKTKQCQTPEDKLPLLKFERTVRGSTKRKSFQIRSTGTAPLRVEKILFAEGTSKDFRLHLEGISFPFVLQPQEIRTIDVEYIPSDKEPDKGQILVHTSAFEKPISILDIEASAVGCEIEAKPERIEFKGPESRDFSITNKGDEYCRFSQIALRFRQDKIFVLQNVPDTKVLLPPKQSLTLRVVHQPDPNATPDFVDIASNDPDKPVVSVELIPFIERPQECKLVATPSPVDFGKVMVGRTRNLPLTVFNVGRSDCTIRSWSVVGTTPPQTKAFALLTALTLPQTLAPTKYLSLEISYKPEGQTEHRGVFLADSNAPAPLNVPLVGSWGSPCLEIVPDVLAFGPSRFNCAARAQKVRVFHIGGVGCPATITVQKASLAPSSSLDFKLGKISQTLPYALTTGRFLEIEVGYRPTDLGPDQGILEITHDYAPLFPEQIPLSGQGVQESEQKETFQQTRIPKADVLFVVDNSCSMGEEQSNLATNFQQFINWAIRLNVDYHIGITTTDVTGVSYPAGCLRGGVKFIDLQTPNPVATFTANVRVGTAGSASERGLEAAYRALSTPTRDNPACNQGFYRQDASLSLVFISDEEDQSPQSVDFYVAFFKSLKGALEIEKVRASVVVGPPPSGCRDSQTGRATSGARYWDLAKQLRGVQSSICSDQWAATLNQIGSITFGYRDQFALARQADPATLQVKVNGQIVPEDPNNGWHYDAPSNSIIFSKAQVPPAGATIEITYKALCL